MPEDDSLPVTLNEIPRPALNVPEDVSGKSSLQEHIAADTPGYNDMVKIAYFNLTQAKTFSQISRGIKDVLFTLEKRRDGMNKQYGHQNSKSKGNGVIELLD